MSRSTPVSRRTVLAALAAFAATPLAGCSPDAPPTTPDIPGVPPAPLSSSAASPMISPFPASVIAPTRSVAVVTQVPTTAEIAATLPPLTTAAAATGTTLASTSAALSATATTAASLGTNDTMIVVIGSDGGTPIAPPAPTPGGLVTIPEVTRPAAVSTAAVPTAISTVAPTAAPPPVFSTTVPAVQATVDKARARFDRVTALHFTLAVEGTVFLDDARSQRLTAADGDLVRPDRVSLTARVAVGSVVAQIKFIQIADSAYLTNILTGRWQTAPSGFSYDPRLVFDPQSGVSAIMGSAPAWMLIEMTKVSGQDTQHLRGIVPAAAAAPLVSNSLRGDYVDVDIYVEPRMSDVLKLVLAEQPAAVTDGIAATKWTLDLSKQNQNISIAAPTVGAVAPR